MLAVHVVIIIYLTYLASDLISLWNDDTYADAFSESDLNPVEGSELPQLIPKIIHQTYKTTEIPDVWKLGQQACKDLHPDYEYILWTDVTAREFIVKEFSWFIPTWDLYPYNIERADAIRYFVLLHYGGVYIDLDDGCQRKLDPLLTVPAFVRKTLPTGVSNDVMGSVPGHPFFNKVIHSLDRHKRNWLVPYITIMFSTGPTFISVIWKTYKRWGVPAEGRIRILMPENYKANADSFFAIAPGSSWHLDDAKFIKGMGQHMFLSTVGIVLIFLIFFYLEYLIYCLVCSNLFKKFFKKTGAFIHTKFSNMVLYFFPSYTGFLVVQQGSEYQPLDRNRKALATKVKGRSRKDLNLPSIEKFLDKETIVDEGTSHTSSPYLNILSEVSGSSADEFEDDVV